jgi:hypothetical protein
VRNEEKSLTKDFLLYDQDIILSENEERLSKLRDETVREFGDPHDSVTLSIRMEWE